MAKVVLLLAVICSLACSSMAVVSGHVVQILGMHGLYVVSIISCYVIVLGLCCMYACRPHEDPLNEL